MIGVEFGVGMAQQDGMEIGTVQTQGRQVVLGPAFAHYCSPMGFQVHLGHLPIRPYNFVQQPHLRIRPQGIGKHTDGGPHFTKLGFLFVNMTAVSAIF